MKIEFNKQQQNSLIWMMDEFIKTHECSKHIYKKDIYKKDIETAKYILTKLAKNKR
jgi:hypothetical protein